MRTALLLLLAAVSFPVAAQDLFPTFSVSASTSPSTFDTNVRIDPEEATGEGTLVNFEGDLGLEDARTVQRFEVQWRPFARHELAATYFSAPRSGREQIDREIVFRDETYPVSALVTTQFDLEYGSATYTYWARRGARDGFGITLGVAALSMNAGITAERPGETITVTQTAETEVPVALAGVQGRVAFGRNVFGEAAVSTLPRVTISDYTGTAITGRARLEYRPVRWFGVGASYNYFRLDVDVDQLDFGGSLDMTIQGPEAFVRLAF
ncbi:MAG TPA: hypothetical protein VF911_18320 [Thermoanaerobaculia bacterium]|jgi:hypothetical protein